MKREYQYLENKQQSMSLKKEFQGDQIGSDEGEREEVAESGISLNIKVIIEDQQGKTVEELIEGLPIDKCLEDPSSGYHSPIVLKKLLLDLKNKMNFPIQNKQIYYFLDKSRIFINCGIDPINDDIKIRPQDYKNRDFITIKAKELGISMVHRLMTFQTFGTSDDKQKGGVDQMAQRSKCRRTKERRIGHIIDKVLQWRKFYSGPLNQKTIAKNQKLSLEDAAKKVQISKKSLDDYLFQIRFGHKYKFNFNEHYNDKVGVLRDFVRQRKKNDKVQNKQRKQNVKEEQKDD